jgi:hypothetical protein
MPVKFLPGLCPVQYSFRKEAANLRVRVQQT